ncbi:MAG: aminotransferase class V-fold PLP-dependent enzyme [Candidatus Dormibacteraeota bacterium]|nr:aminotransferase class V-fold PLP-dependent enzyme [Candidatus Dormibacteraeota bacterium]MBV9525517.1 aminotransferase class V-fold PLP-dependent enzyme [Candidatus Dormibacteraeota bacterium]
MLIEDLPGTERTSRIHAGRMPALAGADLEVPLANGQMRRYVNLDFAASTPAMEAVVETVSAFVPWYSSVHRGTGWTSQVSTRAFEAARRAVHTFVGARPTDEVIFVRNSTEALNLLAHCIPLRPDQVVLSTALEHHANMLPWRRRGRVVHLDPPESPEALLDAVRRALQDRVWPVGLVAVTGASNVTGEVFPVRELATLAHEHDALIAVDAAQLAPHRAIDMVAAGIDCLALSGHKMYAPFGAGALVAPAALMAQAEPLLAGGGAVSYVTLDDVQWAALPDRLEAGSPNVVGAVALGAAATALSRAGMAHVAAHEKRLLGYLDGQFGDIPGLRRLRLWSSGGADRLGVCTFTVEGMHHALVAAALSAEHGIGVRHGCFCAHPYITWLLGVSPEQSGAIRERLRRGEHRDIPGAVRASFGIGTTVEHLDRLLAGLRTLVERGPHLEYREDPATGDYLPADDSRELPRFDLLPPLDADLRGPGCGQF